MSEKQFHPPVELNFFDKYGHMLLSITLVVLFIGSLGGYLYLKLFSVAPDVPIVLLEDNGYKVIAIHQETLRPGQIDNSLIVKVIAAPSVASDKAISITITELNPEFVVVHDSKQRETFIPSSEATQMELIFDVVNTRKLPAQLDFKITIEPDESSPISKTISISVSRLSTEQLALISTVATGVVSLWLLFGQEYVKNKLKTPSSSAKNRTTPR